MKQVLLICAVISATMLVSGSTSNQAENFRLLAGNFLGDNTLRITDEQKQCIEDGYKNVTENYPNLKEWFDDIEATAKNLTEFNKQCQALTGIRQKICFVLFNYVTKREYIRLFGNLTEEQKAAIDDINEVIKECLSDDGLNEFDVLKISDTRNTDETKKYINDGFGKVVKVNSNPKSSLDDNKNKPDITFMIDKQNDSSDNFAKRLFMGLLGTDDNTRITDDQKQCIADGYQKVVDENPDLKSWFDDIQSTFAKLSDDSKQCDELTGLAKLKCKVQVYVAFRSEYRRLFENITEEQQKVLEELRDVVIECLQGSDAQDTVNALELPALRITEAQIDCIKNGYKNVVGDDPELQEWFNDVQETLTTLTGNVKECKALSGLSQVRCYTKLLSTVRTEFKRLLDELSDEQKEILQELQNVIKECLDNNAVY